MLVHVDSPTYVRDIDGWITIVVDRLRQTDAHSAGYSQVGSVVEWLLWNFFNFSVGNSLKQGQYVEDEWLPRIEGVGDDVAWRIALKIARQTSKILKAIEFLLDCHGILPSSLDWTNSTKTQIARYFLTYSPHTLHKEQKTYRYWLVSNNISLNCEF